MRFEAKLKKLSRAQLWGEYCGYLDLSLKDYMFMQHRLLQEQLECWRECGLGQKLLKGKKPENFEQLRAMLPLTSYEDYAETLLPKQADALPGQPVIWIQTTWEGGLRPTKVAPYTREMLDTYRHNLCSLTLLCTSREKGQFSVHKGDRVLYGGASLPYATGLMPSLMSEDIQLDWLPNDKKSVSASFTQRIKNGFTQGLTGGIDFFFGMGAVANSITERFSSMSGGGSAARAVSPTIAARYVKAKYLCRRDGRSMQPKDLFRIKGFVYTGPDSRCYRDALTDAWGVSPIEIAAGTESTCIAAEDWNRNGMVFFPNACFYEFIPEAEMRRSLIDPSYKPRTCLMDEVSAGEQYELVISVFHGGAFMRYRIGDVYRCVSAGPNELPRFYFHDRIPTVIDIAGFTRITEASVRQVINLSKLPISSWFARKEYDEGNRPFLHMYMEIPKEEQQMTAASKQVLIDHLSAYFRYFDSDYADLKKLLSIEPLQIELLKSGVMDAFRQQTGREILRINPSILDVNELLEFQKQYRL